MHDMKTFITLNYHSCYINYQIIERYNYVGILYNIKMDVGIISEIKTNGPILMRFSQIDRL